MTDDIFDYFSGNSNRKVEPIDDDDDQVESSSDPVPSDVTEAEDGPVANEVDEKVSHWDRLLGKLGISPAAKTAAPPKSVQLPEVSAKEKAARASKRKEQEKARGQEVQPFGGIAAPPGSKPIAQPEAPQVAETPRAKSASKATTEAKKSKISKKDKPAAAPSKFGMGILDEISTDGPERSTPHETETLADLFVASEKFEPPFEEVRRDIDDLEPYPDDDREPHSAQRDEASGQTFEIDEEVEEEEAEFIEYEVQDLDFAESDEERPRRPSRRDRARRGRSKPESEDPGTRTGGRGRRDQAIDNTLKPQSSSRRGRNTRNQGDEDLEFEKKEPTTIDADSTPTRGRRRSRGRGRGRGSQDSRPPRDAVDRVEIDDVEIDESLEIAEREEFDDREEGRNRNRGRKPRGASRRPRQESRVRDDDDIDDDSFGDYDDDEPKTARESGRRGQSGDEDMEFESGKRPQIPTWSDAVASMVELNIKARGSKPSGSSRGRGPRRPRRR